MRITPEVVKKAYSDIGGIGCEMRSGYFDEGYDHEDKSTTPRCCGIAAVYLQTLGGNLGAVNYGIGHLPAWTLDQVERDPEVVILKTLAREFDQPESYLMGWVMGFDDTHKDACATAEKHYGETSREHYRRGHEDGKLSALAIFGEEAA